MKISSTNFWPVINDVRPTLKKARLQRKDNHDRDCVAEIFRASLEEFARSGRNFMKIIFSTITKGDFLVQSAQENALGLKML